MINRIKTACRRKGKAAPNAKPHATNGHANSEAAQAPVEPVAAPLGPVSDGAAASQAGRTSGNGRFAPGNKFGRGNPFSRKLAAARQAICDAVSPHDLAGIVAGMVTAAKGGDVAAAQLLFTYLAGRPGAAPDPDRLDLSEYELLAANPTVAEVTRAEADTVPAMGAAMLLQMALAYRSLAKPPKGAKIHTAGFTLEEVSAALGALQFAHSICEDEEIMGEKGTARQIDELRRRRCQQGK